MLILTHGAFILINMKILEKIINHFGSPAELARALEVMPQTVSNWRARKLPIDYAIPIEKATGGKITRYEVITALYEEKEVG